MLQQPKTRKDAKKLFKVDGYERKVRKPIDASRLEVREEHTYTDWVTPDEYNEVDPLLTVRKVFAREISRSTGRIDGSRGFTTFVKKFWLSGILFWN